MHREYSRYVNASDDSSNDLQTLFEKALKDIYDQLVDVKDDIHPDFFNITATALNKAVDEAFPGIDYNSPDYAFTEALKQNNKVFAAFKTHRQQNDIAAQLLDADGNLKSFDQFRKDVAPIIGDYNVNWLQTEYDTAVIRADMAARFKEFERDADLYPNLKWLRSTSVEKREAHVKLYGLILPITDEFWTKIFPGNDWNCKCGITNTDEAPNGDKYGLGDVADPPAGLEGNPAFTNMLFGKKHPYRTQAYPGAARAVKKFTK